MKADAHLAAEEAKMVASKALESKKLATATEMAKQRADADAEQGVYAATQRLKREEGEAKLDEARQAIRLAKMQKEQEVELQALADQKVREDIEVQQLLEVEERKASQAHKLLTQKFELEATLTPINLQKAALDATTSVYSKLPIREVKLVSLGGDGGGGGTTTEGGGGLAGILPQVAAATEAWTAVSPAR